MKIWLDDQLDDPRPELKARHTPPGWTGAKNGTEFKQLIDAAVAHGTEIEIIDFDNDLGEELEGKHLLRWLIDTHPEIAVTTEMSVHSQNNVARQELLALIQDCKDRKTEILEKKSRPPYEDLFAELDSPK